MPEFFLPLPKIVLLCAFSRRPVLLVPPQLQKILLKRTSRCEGDRELLDLAQAFGFGIEIPDQTQQFFLMGLTYYHAIDCQKLSMNCVLNLYNQTLDRMKRLAD